MARPFAYSDVTSALKRFNWQATQPFVQWLIQTDNEENNNVRQKQNFNDVLAKTQTSYFLPKNSFEMPAKMTTIFVRLTALTGINYKHSTLHTKQNVVHYLNNWIS